MRRVTRQSLNHRTGIHSLSFPTLFPDVRAISPTLEAHALFETAVGSEKLTPMMFQQTVFSCRKTARVTRSKQQFSTATFLLSSDFSQLDPAHFAGSLQQMRPKVCTTTAAEKKLSESVWLGDSKVWSISERQSHAQQQMSTESHRSAVAAPTTV